MFHILSHPVRTALVFAALAFGIIGLTGTASAQSVISVNFEVRTGGDNLRGGNDNAFISVSTTRGRVVRQLNQSNRELKDHTTALGTVFPLRGTRLDQITGISLSVEGFNGGFNGDNWNVDGLRVTALLDDGRRIRLMNEFASPLVRFTGQNKNFTRRLR